VFSLRQELELKYNLVEIRASKYCRVGRNNGFIAYTTTEMISFINPYR
jgi:hypothetical protein